MIGISWVVVVVIEWWLGSVESVGKGGLMRAEVREKNNKIVIYTSTVTVQIFNVYIYPTIAKLMQSRFRKYCVNFASFYILHNFAPTDVSSLTTCWTK